MRDLSECASEVVGLMLAVELFRATAMHDTVWLPVAAAFAATSFLRFVVWVSK